MSMKQRAENGLGNYELVSNKSGLIAALIEVRGGGTIYTPITHFPRWMTQTIGY